MSRPETAAARQHISATSACTSSVTSRLVPPVDRLAFRRSVTSWPAGRHRMVVQAERVQVADRVRVQLDLGQLARVSVAATRVGVGDGDQLADRALAVAGHRGRPQLRGGRQLAVDDQHPVVGAWQERLDQDGAAGRGRLGVGRGRLAARAHADGDVGALVAAEWLDHDRAADLRRAPAAASSALPTTMPSGTGMPAAASSCLASFLSAAMSTPTAERPAGERRADEPPGAAVAEPEQAPRCRPGGPGCRDRRAAAAIAAVLMPSRSRSAVRVISSSSALNCAGAARSTSSTTCRASPHQRGGHTRSRPARRPGTPSSRRNARRRPPTWSGPGAPRRPARPDSSSATCSVTWPK